MYQYFQRVPFILLFFAFWTNSFTAFSLKPKRPYINDMDSIYPGIHWKEQLIPVNNNISLNVWHIVPIIKNNHNDHLIVIAGGDQGNLSYYALHAAALALQGFQVVLFDYRGYGKSSPYSFDDDLLYTDLFKDDLLTVMQWTSQHCKFKKRGILGFSMGSIIAQMAALEVKTDFMIYDGFMLNPIATSKRIQQTTGVEMQVPQSAYDFERKMKKIKVPTLIFASLSDIVSTKEDAMNYCKQRKNRKYELYQGDHLGAFKTLSNKSFGDELSTKVSAFINK